MTMETCSNASNGAQYRNVIAHINVDRDIEDHMSWIPPVRGDPPELVVHAVTLMRSDSSV
jgi:hypothetical protein